MVTYTDTQTQTQTSQISQTMYIQKYLIQKHTIYKDKLTHAHTYRHTQRHKHTSRISQAMYIQKQITQKHGIYKDTHTHILNLTNNVHTKVDNKEAHHIQKYMKTHTTKT